jgi:hypothetical protein
MIRRLIGITALAMLSLSAQAASLLTVAGFVSPAFVEHADGKREPLAVGMGLSTKEKVHTGAGGRALMKLSEGSAVKLGENATLAVDQLGMQDSIQGGVISASLEVVRGAFRFTTGLLGKSATERDVRVKVNTITAGIRGTDVWGKSETSRDIVCLLEGRVTVSHGGQQLTMTEPNSFYIAPRKGKPLPVASVSPEQVRTWSAETEIQRAPARPRRRNSN